MKKIHFISILLLAFILSVNAQYNTFNKQYIYVYPGVSLGADYNTLVQTNDRSYMICRGVSDSSNLYTNQHYEFFKTNREGNPLWGKDFFKGASTPSINRVTGNCIIQTSDAGYLLATSQYVNNSPQIVLIKTDSMGNFIWSKNYPGEGISKIYSVQQTTNSGFVVCGSTTDSSNVQFAYIFQVDSLGNYDWGKKIVASGDTVAGFISLVEIAGQGYVAAGNSGQSAFAVCIDFNGNLIWNKNLFNSFGNFYSVALTSDPSLVFAGSYIDSVDHEPHACLVKTDLAGNLLWKKGLQSVSTFYTGSYVWSIKATSSGGFVYAGYVADPIPTTFIGTANSNGNVLMCNEYHSTFHTFNYTPQSLITTLDGGFALTTLAGTYSGPNAVYSTEFLKTDAAGVAGCDGLNYPVIFIALNDTFSSGASVFNCGTAIPFTATLTVVPINDTIICENILDPDPSGIEKINSSTFELSQNVPNPFTDQTTITYHLNAKGENVLFEIYDSRGVKVFEKIQSNILPGDYSIALNKNNFSNGIYFYSLIVDGMINTKKMIIAN